MIASSRACLSRRRHDRCTASFAAIGTGEVGARNTTIKVLDGKHPKVWPALRRKRCLEGFGIIREDVPVSEQRWTRGLLMPQSTNEERELTGVKHGSELNNLTEKTADLDGLAQVLYEHLVPRYAHRPFFFTRIQRHWTVRSTHRLMKKRGRFFRRLFRVEQFV